MNCVYCWWKFCSCWWKRCRCSNAVRNRDICIALAASWIARLNIAHWSQTDKVKEIIEYIKEEYPIQVKLDIKEIAKKFWPEETDIEKAKRNMNIRMDCQYEISMPWSKCRLCWRPKYHRDQFWWDCKVLLKKYWLDGV